MTTAAIWASATPRAFPTSSGSAAMTTSPGATGTTPTPTAVARGIKHADTPNSSRRSSSTTTSAVPSTTRPGDPHQRRRRLHVLPDLRGAPKEYQRRTTHGHGRGELRVREALPDESRDVAPAGVLDDAQRRHRAASTATSTRGSSSRDGRSHLDTPGSQQMSYASRFFAGGPGTTWFRRSAQGGDGGYGTFATNGTPQRQRLSDGGANTRRQAGHGLHPERSAITVDMTKLAGGYGLVGSIRHRGVHARRGLTVPNLGSRQFAPPGTNGDGAGDWVLVLTAP